MTNLYIKKTVKCRGVDREAWAQAEGWSPECCVLLYVSGGMNPTEWNINIAEEE